MDHIYTIHWSTEYYWNKLHIEDFVHNTITWNAPCWDLSQEVKVGLFSTTLRSVDICVIPFSADKNRDQLWQVFILHLALNRLHI